MWNIAADHKCSPRPPPPAYALARITRRQAFNAAANARIAKQTIFTIVSVAKILRARSAPRRPHLPACRLKNDAHRQHEGMRVSSMRASKCTSEEKKKARARTDSRTIRCGRERWRLACAQQDHLALRTRSHAHEHGTRGKIVQRFTNAVGGRVVWRVEYESYERL